MIVSSVTPTSVCSSAGGASVAAAVVPPPPLGAHNRQVLGGLLGLTDADLEELAAEELIGDAPKPHEL